PAAPAAAAAPPAARAHAPAPPPEIVPIVVVQIRGFEGRPATFVTDKGELWIQTDSQRQLPNAPFKAKIRPGAMSSYFLVPDDYGHSYRVRPGP
ncbi:MAG TPA: hypothetical protein VHH11_05255, partial [Gammaproteobacteria bacterium]|nr:hypothetical protein [Gammaproteobacteria bacterium]